MIDRRDGPLIVDDIDVKETKWTVQAGILLTTILLVLYMRPYILDFKNILVEQSAVIGGGLLSGSLHALTGPDHVAAVLPFAVGQRWYLSTIFGGLWGLGHGISACFMGVCGYYIKGSVLFSMVVPQLIGLTDYAVGATLIVIGLMGIHEARIEEAEAETPIEASEGDYSRMNEMSTRSTSTVSSLFNDDQHDDSSRSGSCSGDAVMSIAEGGNHGNIIQHSNNNNIELQQPSVKTDCSNSVPRRPKRKVNPSVIIATIFINGGLLGLSWDGLPSLSPALAMDAWSQALLFFLSYLVGTVLTMAITTAIIGESTRLLGSISNINLPKRLALASSVCAIAIGAFWIVHSLVKFIEISEDERFDGKFTWSWLACCVLGIGSPLAVVGVIVMTVLKELGIVIHLPRPPCCSGDNLEDAGMCPFNLLSDHFQGGSPYSPSRFRKGEIHTV